MTAGPGDADRTGNEIRPAAGPPSRVFTAEIRAAVRFEAGLVVKAVAVLAALTVFLVLRALYLA